MVYFLVVILVLLGFLGRRNRYALFAISIILWIIFGLNTNNPDFINYFNAYNNIFSYAGNISEPGFQLLMKIFSSIGANYQVFLAFVAAVSIFLIVKTVWDFSPYPCLVLCLYFFYPFTLDVVQIRSTLASAIIVFAFRYIINYRINQKKKYLVFFVLLVILASSIHFSSALYLIALSMFIKNKTVRRLIVIGLPIVLVVIVFNLSSFSSIIGNYIGSYKASVWASQLGGMPILRQIVTLILKVCLVLFCYLSLKLYKEYNHPEYYQIYKNTKYIYSPDFSVISKSIYEIVLYLSALSVFEIFISSTYERLGRPSILLAYILITRSISIDYRKNSAMDKLLLIVLSSLFFLFYMFFTAGYYTWFDIVFKEVLENNVIIH